MYFRNNEEITKLFRNIESQEETTYKTRWNLDFAVFLRLIFLKKGIKVFIRTQLIGN